MGITDYGSLISSIICHLKDTLIENTSICFCILVERIYFALCNYAI